MKRYSNRQTTQKTKRTGFTLIELMVVIGLVAVLASLLLVATGGVRGSAKKAEVKAELAAIETALANFSSQFGGQLPPSQVTLHETQSGWDGDPRSKQIISSLWPQFDFSKTRDFDAGGSATNVLLQGPYCLVFFLGGIPKIDDNQIVGDNSDDIIYVNGFSKNPADPFDPDSTNRTPSLFEFDPARLKAGASYDVTTAAGPDRPFAYVAYLDKHSGQTLPIWYLSSYGRSAYREADLPPSMQTASGGNGVYKQGSKTDSPAWNANSYQIISPGLDGDYGLGGYYSSDGKSKFLGTSGDSTTDPGEGDRDNITNFSSGTLD